MGLEFMRSVERRFRRQWGRGLEDLLGPRLFDAPLELETRRFAALPREGHRLTAGESLVGLLEPAHARIVVMRDTEFVAWIDEIPLSILNSINNKGCGVAVVRVHEVHPLSGASDVTLS